MAGLCLFQEYVLRDVQDRQHLIVMHKKAKKLGIDLTQYNQLKEQLTKTEYSLKKLRHPLRVPTQKPTTISSSLSDMLYNLGQSSTTPPASARSASSSATTPPPPKPSSS